MSKWHKVLVHEDHFNDGTKIEDFLTDLAPIGRWKAKPFRDANNNDYWCFKFKDKIAAMAFKLRWI